MELDLVDIISILYTFGAVILIVFLLSAKTSNVLSNQLLSAYLFLTIIDTSSRVITLFVYSRSPVIGMLLSETVFLLAPLFYLFVKSSVYKDFKLNSKTLLHLIPFLLINLILIPGYYLPLLQNTDADWVKLVYDSSLYKYIYIGIHAQQNIYYFFIFKMLFRYRKILLENYSSPKLDNPKWLFQLVILYFINETIAMIKNIIRFNSVIEVYDVAQMVVSVTTLILIFWLIIKALRNPNLFSGVYTDIKLVRTMLQSKDEKKENQVEETNKLILQLNQHMKQNEPYLDSALSMHDLAKQLDVPVRELSIAINHQLNKHFFDFVNEYRIKKAQDLIRNSTDEKQTILEILYEVGFNSKSSFNTAFKKHTGLTPTEFKKNTSLKVA